MTSLPFYKPRKRRSNPETRLQIVVMQHLELQGVPDLMAFHVKNGGKESPQTGLLLKRMGVKAGVADLFVGIPFKRPLFLELKSRGQKLTENQKSFGSHCERMGYFHAMADNIDDALAILRDYGAIKTAARAAAE